MILLGTFLEFQQKLNLTQLITSDVAVTYIPDTFTFSVLCFLGYWMWEEASNSKQHHGRSSSKHQNVKVYPINPILSVLVNIYINPSTPAKDNFSISTLFFLMHRFNVDGNIAFVSKSELKAFLFCSSSSTLLLSVFVAFLFSPLPSLSVLTKHLEPFAVSFSLWPSS